LVLEGLRRRLGLAAVAWACATVIVAAAVLGAVFALAAAESDLRDVLDGAPLDTAAHFQMRSSDGFEQLNPEEAEAALRSGAGRLRNEYFSAPIASLYAPALPEGVELLGQLVTPPPAPVAYRSGVCGHVRLLHGRCPVGPDEAMVSTRSAASPWGYRLDRPLAVGQDAAGNVLTVEVVGLYAPLDSTEPYWGGPQYFNSGVGSGSKDTGAAGDAVFVDRSFYDRLGATTPVRAAFDRLVDTSRVRLRDLPDLEHAVSGFRTWSSGHGDAFDLGTNLHAVLARAAGQRAAIYASTALVVLQLCVLGWIVLFRILQEFIGGRDAEVVLAKLRGYRLAALLRFSSAESLVVLVLAAPSGILAGWFVASRLSAGVLQPGTPVVLTPVAVLAGAAAIAGGVLAVAVSAISLLRRSISEQSRRTRQTATPSRLLAAVDVLVLVTAAVAFVLLRAAGDRGGILTLLAPGLLIVAVGSAAGTALPLLLAPVVGRTANRRRVAVLLAVRQVVRRPAGRRLVSLLTVAVGLAVFGVSGEAMAAQNRDARSAVEVGATAVQRLTVIPGDDPVAAVKRADPDGRWATAAAEWLTFGGGDLRGTLLAVDSSRLAAITPAVPGIQDPAAIARALQSPVPPVALRGRRVQVQAALSDLRGKGPALLIELLRPDGSDTQLDLGTMGSGQRTYSADLPCGGGCTLVGLDLDASTEGRTATGELVLQRVAVDGRRVDADLTTRGAWRAQEPLGDASDRVRVDARGVGDRFELGSGGTAGIAHNGLPDPPGVLATAAGVSRSSPGSRLTVTSSDESTAELRVAGDRTVLPGVIGDGVVADAPVFQRALPSFVPDAAWAVWLGPAAPADARQRLERAGLVLDGRPATLAARRAALAREGPALALLLLQVMGIAGVLCAISGVVVSIRSVLRRRSYEGAALLTVGISRRQLLGAILTEQALLLGSAVVFGIPAGLLAIVLVMPALREANTPTAVPQVVLPPAPPVVALVVVLVALVLLAIALSARSVVRAARGSRLREGEE
jgi:hypothetical protein